MSIGLVKIIMKARGDDIAGAVDDEPTGWWVGGRRRAV